jgi:polyphenol oxidase
VRRVWGRRNLGSLNYYVMVFIPEIFRQFKNVIGGQSMRHGGVSEFPYKSLNLGFSTSDKKENVLKNRELFFSELGITENQVAFSGQVHGVEILVAESAGRREGFDSVITNKKNLFVAVSVADCCPVLIYDAKNNAVAAIHAGWRGTANKIVTETLRKMKAEFGTSGENCYAYIGTCISECSFEVGADVAEKFEIKFVRYDENKKKYFVDLKKANKQQLLATGLEEKNIEVSPYCTIENNEDYFSYRREGQESGRMLGVIGIHDSPQS